MNKSGTSIGQGNFVEPRVRFKKNGNAIAAIQIMEFQSNSRFFSDFVMRHLCVDSGNLDELV